MFSSADLNGIARLMTDIRERKAELIGLWSELHSSMFGPLQGASEDLFHRTYVPHLRGALLRLANGDMAGFVTFAANLGEQLAETRMPFSVMVGHFHLLKEACTKLLMTPSGQVDPAVFLTIDKLSACVTSVAADSYYARWCAVPPVASEPLLDRARACAGSTAGGIFHGLVGRSPGMQWLFSEIERLAAATVPVLIAGETGTGKELIARAIHNCSPRCDGPFIAINCAALPRELIESELFGYKRGAFSGALNDHIGLFAAATGGTLLLDEITEMSPDLQAKLLRVLQEQSVRPVGSVTEVPIDVRIIGSTNHDPGAVLSCGALRTDLYYRLCVSILAVPPLRERREDIPFLVEYRLAQLSERYGLTPHRVRGIHSNALAELMQRSWPGNVRELFNVLENAFSACRSTHIDVQHLPQRGGEIRVEHPGREAKRVPTFEETERTLISQALVSTGGNKLMASRLLGISRKKLYAKLAKYALPALVAGELLEDLMESDASGSLLRIGAGLFGGAL